MDRVDIWVMKEYNVHSSWTKTLVLRMDTIPHIFPICCTKCGDIVGTIRYDDKGEFLEHTYYVKVHYMCIFLYRVSAFTPQC